MRVHELSKILGVSSKDLMKDFRKMKISVKGHMSSIDDKTVRRLMNLYEKRKEAARKKQEAEEERKRKEDEKKRKQEAEAQARAEAMRKAEEAKRRREEIERIRKEREELRKKELQEAKDRANEAKKKAAALREQKKKKEEKASEKKKPPRPVKRKPYPVKEQKGGRTSLPKAAQNQRKPSKEKEEEVPLLMPTIEVMRLKPTRREKRKKKPEEKSRPRRGTKRGRYTKRDDATQNAAQDTQPKTKKSKAATHKIRPSFVVAPSSSTALKKAPAKEPKPKAPSKPNKIRLHGDFTVAQFAQKANISVNEIIKKALLMGEAITINEQLDPDMTELIATEYNIELEIIPETDEYDIEKFIIEDDDRLLKSKPPVVTVMGHVDHGKTTLLDRIRESNVVQDEYGGITQHIGAYLVRIPKGDIVFLDTPGHEAFTSMRARGASVTDIVILLVAADDGVMPQTVEAINHARAANVPLIVAVNKIDLPDANVERIKQQLLQHDLVPEDLGGETIFVEISAKQGHGIPDLLEMILLQAEMLELKANPDRPAEGIIIESKIDPLKGATVTVLIRKGTLNIGDVFLCGDQFGKVKAMFDDHGVPVYHAGPGHPVELTGLGGTPAAGELLIELPDERTARRIAETRIARRREKALQRPRHITLENLHEYIEEGKSKELLLILKADVKGSLEAVSESLEKLGDARVRVRIIHSAVGGVLDSDVNLAAASDAIIIGFNVRPETSVVELAEKEGVEIKTYRVIYELLDDMRKAMAGLLEPQYKEIVKGKADVREVFRISKVGNVAGCFVTEGTISLSDRARLIRDNVVVYDGKIFSLRRVKDEVNRVQVGVECGIGLERFDDVKENDVIEAYALEEIPVEI